MGIEHRIKEEKEENLFKCPHCGCIDEYDQHLPKDQKIECSECNEELVPYDNIATWEDFWEYTQSLKHL